MLLNIIQENRQILTEEGKRKAQELRADFGETSAKTRFNIEDVSSITYTQLLFDVEVNWTVSINTYIVYQY